MSRTRVALLVLFFATVMVPLAPAQASYTVVCTGYTSCADAGYPHAGYASAKGTSYWNMYTGTNCTNYVAYRLVTTNGMPNKRPKAGVGNARDWGTAMASVTNSTPTVGAVAWWGKTGNHVAYIERVVSSSEIWVSESNWSGAFDWRKITKSGGGWPDGIIHFADLAIANTAAPAISGTVKVGGAVEASDGSWKPAAQSYGYQWYADGVEIGGATAKSFTPTSSQLNKTLTVAVTATRAGYPSSTAVSAGAVVAPGSLTPTTPPSVSGTLRYGGTLTASPGTWSPAPSAFGYQWTVGGVDVAGATETTFKPRAQDVGKPVTIRVRAAKGGYSAVFATSAPTADLGAAPMAATSRPTVAGTPQVGKILTATQGTWSRTGLSFSYQWLSDGDAVADATGATYAARSVDVGHAITVEVTARRDGFVTTTSSSAATARVAPGTLTRDSKPSVSGNPRVGSRLTASPGSWSPTADVSYQWYADGRAVAGATERIFVPGPRDRGAQIKVRVTAHRAGYTSAGASSGTTGRVASGHIRVTRAPAITGKPVLGTTLKVDSGDTSPAQASARYQWLRDGLPVSGARGRSHRVTSSDLGHRLSVRVSLKASGYSSQTITTSQLPRAKSAPKISVAIAKPSSGTVTFTIRVTASKVPAPGGTMTVRPPSGPARTVAISRGRATITVKGQPAGAQTFRFAYRGTSTIASATLDKTTTVR